MNTVAMSALVLLLPLIVSGCIPEKRTGVLIAEFSGRSSARIFKPSILLPSAEDEYSFNYEFKKGEVLCTLTGELDRKEIPRGDECPGTTGRGKLICNNGKSMKLRWSLTSCRSGFGQSIEKGNSKFFFVFERNKERALDQLINAKE